MIHNILGINCTSHDTSACLVKDGAISGFVEEERLNREKHTTAFPTKSIDWVLANGGLTIDDLDAIAVATTNHEPWGHFFRYPKYFGFVGSLILLASNIRYRIKFAKDISSFKKRIKNKKIPIYFVDHHKAHAANGFLISPFQKAAILTIDGIGDGLSSRLAYGSDNNINFIGEYKFPDSIGYLYERFTHQLGFNETGDEGKVMGLSPYGEVKSEYKNVFSEIVRLDSDGAYQLTPAFLNVKRTGFLRGTFALSQLTNEKLGPARKKGEPLNQNHQDIAATLQRTTESTVFHVLKNLYTETSCENLVISGGVGLNSVCNGKIHLHTPFKNIFVNPVVADNGNAIGAAYYVWNIIFKQPRNFVLKDGYLGPEYSTKEVKKLIDEYKLSYENVDNISRKAAELIADGKIIGWFQGKMEAGARALGNRSILADPRIAGMKDQLNNQVKFREPFRPFAPAILEEKIGDYFVDVISVPFMEKVLPIKPEKHSVIPAVTHVDGSGRLQSINRSSNPRYYDLIKEFENITGVPVVINTSFNIKGEPIVCSPTDAIRCFFSTGMDYLIIDKFLIKK